MNLPTILITMKNTNQLANVNTDQQNAEKLVTFISDFFS